MRPLQTCIVPRQNQRWGSGRWDGELEEEKLLHVSAVLLCWKLGEYLSPSHSDMALKATVTVETGRRRSPSCTKHCGVV